MLKKLLDRLLKGDEPVPLNLWVPEAKSSEVLEESLEESVHVFDKFVDYQVVKISPFLSEHTFTLLDIDDAPSYTLLSEDAESIEDVLFNTISQGSKNHLELSQESWIRLCSMPKVDEHLIYYLLMHKLSIVEDLLQYNNMTKAQKDKNKVWTLKDLPLKRKILN